MDELERLKQENEKLKEALKDIFEQYDRIYIEFGLSSAELEVYKKVEQLLNGGE